jgi:hypothetical protein
VAELRERLIVAEQRRVEEVTEAAVRQSALEQVRRLRAELDTALARAREVGARIPATSSTSSQGAGKSGRRYYPGRDYEPKKVRAWAREAGKGDQVPQYGPYLPDSLVAAYLRAQTLTEQPAQQADQACGQTEQQPDAAGTAAA